MAPVSAVSPAGVTELRHAAEIAARLRQAQGQVRGVLRMYEEGRSCLKVLDQLSAAQAALRAIALLMIEDHVTGCFEPVASLSEDEERATRLLTAIARVPRQRDGVPRGHVLQRRSCHMFKTLSLAVLTAAAIGLLPVAAFAETSSAPTGREYGQHVAQCAHLMGGFTGFHNPGMHQGFAGWNDMP